MPDHRKDIQEISIEFYYKDCEIKREDSNGKRLFLSNEFDSRTQRHRKNTELNCSDSKVRNNNKITIIDNDVYNQGSENIALPKNDFANYILNKESNFDDFDFSEFEKVFTLISEILRK